jgi:hypothetical protein
VQIGERALHTDHLAPVAVGTRLPKRDDRSLGEVASASAVRSCGGDDDVEANRPPRIRQEAQVTFLSRRGT